MKRILKEKTMMNFNESLTDIIKQHNEFSKKYIIRKGIGVGYIIERIIGQHEYESITNIPFNELENVRYTGDIAALIYIYISKENRHTLDSKWNKVKNSFKRLLNAIKDLFVKKSGLFDKVEEPEIEEDM